MATRLVANTGFVNDGRTFGNAQSNSTNFPVAGDTLSIPATFTAIVNNNVTLGSIVGAGNVCIQPPNGQITCTGTWSAVVVSPPDRWIEVTTGNLTGVTDGSNTTPATYIKNT